eukprot:CAMPEP_0202863236 /NCGR_PEP_ID=MMETSP1391-20130828/3945_1 /ASSEMBLY_ACC=CAM_ASM_000867 /TAXON_ID=1034604 /ORGANISM="Chlamydomonas leiostraca, Strain SAG 11-49" /LENGTH=784 /DNA_ID=CAMNT_0049542847 /DNA_START=190 /DNA_END=2544 /DNA_ORIENTATION=-
MSAQAAGDAASTAADAKPAVPEVPSGVEAEAAALAAFAEVPTLGKVVARAVGPARAQGAPRDLWLTVNTATRNLPANTQRKASVSALLPAGSTQVLGASVPTEAPADTSLLAPAPSGRQQLAFKSGAEGCSMSLCMWNESRLLFELQVPKGLHGALVNDGYFAAGAAWSPGEDAVAYTAEVPPGEKTPVWCGQESLKDAAGAKGWRGVGTANEDWGELNTGKRLPAVYVLDAVTRTVIKATASLPAEVSFGQPAWCPGGSGLVVVGWQQYNPGSAYAKRLGVVFCYNRACALYYIPLARSGPGGALVAGEPVAITDLGSSAVSPTFNPSGTTLAYISHHTALKTGTHSATATLNTLPWPKAAAGGVAPRVAVDIPAGHPTPGSFPGLYTTSIPDDGFLSDTVLLLNAQWRSTTSVLAVDVATGSVSPVTPVDSASDPLAANGGSGMCGSYSLSAVAGGRVVGTRVAMDAVPQVVVADLPADPQDLVRQGAQPLAWSAVAGLGSSAPLAVADALANLEVVVQSVTPTIGNTGHTFQSTVLMPRKREGPLPALIMPHGGPHTAITAGWYPAYAFLASLGYAVICPNYRGSTGFSQESLASLPGKCGSHDVQDCMDALGAAVAAGWVDSGRVGVVGGSHGGFLTGHLLGQHPDRFKAGVMRNPVCNIALMVGMTDITDWCYVEVLGSEAGMKRGGAVPTPEDLAAMWAASPIAHVSKVKAPMTIMLGAKDRRVPPPDGLAYASALRAAGVPVRVLVFPEDTHALDRPQTEYEQWVNVTAVMKEHLAA